MTDEIGPAAGGPHEKRGEAMRDAEPLSHARARRLMSFAWDGELKPQEHRSLAAHLAECENCRKAARRMWTFLDDMEDLLGGERETKSRRPGKNPPL